MDGNVKIKIFDLTNVNYTEMMNKFKNKFEHLFKVEIEALRAIIMHANNKIAERTKRIAAGLQRNI